MRNAKASPKGRAFFNLSPKPAQTARSIASCFPSAIIKIFYPSDAAARVFLLRKNTQKACVDCTTFSGYNESNKTTYERSFYAEKHDRPHPGQLRRLRGLPRHGAHRRELFSPADLLVRRAGPPEDVLSRSELVEARAKELGFWRGLTFRMERWLTDGKSELEAVGREEFQSRIAEDYAAYREKADAARARFRDRRRAAPFNFTPTASRTSPSRT